MSDVKIPPATPGTNPAWFVFALTNTTDKAVERWLVADRYGTVGSGVVWPDLDARRVDAVTPSVGFVPERIKNDRADVFRLTLEPGQTVMTRNGIWLGREWVRVARSEAGHAGVIEREQALKALRKTVTRCESRVAELEAGLMESRSRLVALDASRDKLHARVNQLHHDLVNVRGAHEALSALKDEPLQPYVDLAHLGPGQYTLQVHVDSRNSYLVAAIEPTTVSVRIR